MNTKRKFHLIVNYIVTLFFTLSLAEDSDKILYNNIINEGQSFFKEAEAEIKIESINLLKKLLRLEQFDRLEARLLWYEIKSPIMVDGANQFQRVCDQIDLNASDQAYLDTWCEKKSNSAFAWLIRGIFYLDQAWKIRGKGFSSDVSGKKFDLFYKHIKKAGVNLKKALELNPTIGSIYTKLIDWAGCGGPTLDEAEKYYNEAMEVAPNDIFINNTMRYVYTAKWHGSDEKQLEFARCMSLKDPALGFLVGYAHQELANTASQYGKKRLEFFNYFKKNNVWDEIFSSYKKLLIAYPKSKRRMAQLFRYAVYADRVDILFSWLRKENLLEK